MNNHNNYGSRMPLNMQPTRDNDIIEKAKKNPSYETFRDNKIHKPQYEVAEMKDRPSVADKSRIRRNLDGTLDFVWVVNLVLDAVHKAEDGAYLTPLEESLLTVVFPVKFRRVEPMQAEIRTKMSRSEKSNVADEVKARLREELNWNAGMGGGSVPDRHKTRQ